MPGGNFGTVDPTGSEGTDYGVTTLEGPGEAEILIPVGTDTDSWVIKAPQSNSGAIYIGWDDDVDSNTGYPLQSRESISVSIDNGNQPVYGESAQSGDEIRYLAVE